MKYLIYLHGFNSSPQSEKAQLVTAYFQSAPVGANEKIEVIVPALPPAPLDAIALVHDLIQQKSRDNLLGFVGSSLGGFYSLYLQAYYSQKDSFQGGRKLKTVLINPAVHPYDLLVDYLGENQNMYTGECYIIEPQHMDDLKSLAIRPIVDPATTLVLTQTDDEVLNYQEALIHLKGASMWIQYGGSHAYDDFESVLPSIFNFCFKK